MQTKGVWAMLLGALIPAPAATLTEPVQPAAATTLSQSPDAVHATRGVVKTIGPTTLVVSRPKRRGDIVFKLSPSPHIEGTIVVGATVSVRYRDDGDDHVATAISVKKQLD